MENNSILNVNIKSLFLGYSEHVHLKYISLSVTVPDLMLQDAEHLPFLRAVPKMFFPKLCIQTVFHTRSFLLESYPCFKKAVGVGGVGPDALREPF